MLKYLVAIQLSAGKQPAHVGALFKTRTFLVREYTSTRWKNVLTQVQAVVFVGVVFCGVCPGVE
jgi:hypothetical protein